MDLTVKGDRAEIFVKNDTGEIEKLGDGEVLWLMGYIFGRIEENSHGESAKIQNRDEGAPRAVAIIQPSMKVAAAAWTKEPDISNFS
jgi:hypothetical protein